MQQHAQPALPKPHRAYTSRHHRHSRRHAKPLRYPNKRERHDLSEQQQYGEGKYRPRTRHALRGVLDHSGPHSRSSHVHAAPRQVRSVEHIRSVTTISEQSRQGDPVMSRASNTRMTSDGKISVALGKHPLPTPRSERRHSRPLHRREGKKPKQNEVDQRYHHFFE